MNRQKRRLILGIDKALSQSFWRQVLFLGILMIVAFVISLGLIFFTGCNCEVVAYCESKHIWKIMFPIYLLIDSNALNNLYDGDNIHGWMMFFSVITYLFGIFIFNGLLIGVITNYIEHRVQDHRDGLIHYLKKDHHIIMGYDDMVPSIIADIFDEKHDPQGNVMILSSYDVKQIKERLKKSVLRDKLDQIIVNYGQKTAYEYYKDIINKDSK